MKQNSDMQHVFIIGCKGIPAAYGGYETFVDKLTALNKSKNVKYHVACAVDDITIVEKEFEYNNAHCFNIEWKKIGPARAIFYDVDALNWAIEYVKKEKINKPIFYILACRIGPFMRKIQKKIHELNGVVFVNPDGHEWLRAKWSAPVRQYWKLSEKLMVKYSDLMICDSKNIEKYIKEEYKKYQPKTTFIAYGADTHKSALTDDNEKLIKWYQEKGLSPKNYFLVVGRFVPENNYETMIREFMKSNTKKSFALITNVSDVFLQELKEKTGFHKDGRIKFVGTVYDQELLKKIRENAYGYFHGHEVGGTNPSLLEALGSTDLNLLLDVGFNREVAEDAALYWSKKRDDLASLIDNVDALSEKQIKELGRKAKDRIIDAYSWDYISDQYVSLFMGDR